MYINGWERLQCIMNEQIEVERITDVIEREYTEWINGYTMKGETISEGNQHFKKDKEEFLNSLSKKYDIDIDVLTKMLKK